MINTARPGVSADSASESLPDVEKRTHVIKEGARDRVMRVLNSWDRGIDNVSEHVGDALSEGFRTFFRHLIHGKPKPRTRDVPREQA